MNLIFATRPSALARWQTQWVMAALQKIHPGLICEEKIITTQGDKILDKPLPEIGGKGLFTQELEAELLSGSVHCAVHSLKDLPVENPAGLIVGSVPVRAEPRDALISAQGYHLQTLPPSAIVGTSSLRRSSQILSVRPDVSTTSLRGNVDTRLRKALDGQYDAILLAGAGLIRLGLESHVTQWLSLDVMLPAPGQGALGIQCRDDDHTTLELIVSLEDFQTRAAVGAERQFLQGLGGGCAIPVAAFANCTGDKKNLSIFMTGLVTSTDGKNRVKVSGKSNDPFELGNRLAQEAIAQGAREILQKVSNKQLQAGD